MATNKHASIRYNTLDKCLSNRGRNYTINDLIQECSDAIYNHDGTDKGVSLRTLRSDLSFIQSEAGYQAEVECFREGRKHYYRYADPDYSFKNRGLNENEANQLKEVLLTLSRFQGMPQFEWVNEMTTRLNTEFNLDREHSSPIIAFEQNPYLKGLDFIADFYQAILHKKPIEIVYQSYKMIDAQEGTFHPYFLKQYNNRWFVMGQYDHFDGLAQLALDRVQSYQMSTKEFKENNGTDFNEHFEDLVGVSKPKEAESEIVRLKVNEDLWPYIASKPIHQSQRERKEEAGEDFKIIELDVILNYELKSQLLSYGQRISVESPVHLVDEMRTMAEGILRNYIKEN